jgi:hypothetical protein
VGLEFERIRPTIHSAEILLTISKQRTQRIFRVLNSAGLEPYLRNHPLGQIALADFNDPRFLGFYDISAKAVWVNVKRAESTYGQVFLAGQIKTISSAASTRDQAIARSLLHEAAHHLKFSSLVGTHFESLIRETFKIGQPISIRAGSDWKEYFVECLLAFHFHQREFLSHDSLGYDMILNIRKALELP